MNIIVTDQGFGSNSSQNSSGVFNPDAKDVMVLEPDTNPALLPALATNPDLEMIIILFPSFADGRGFTLARILRHAGFAGRLQARGHVLADQYSMARRVGFDEVCIDDTLAQRQDQPQWQDRSDWQAHDYQSKLRG